jgi:hypothetical protein
MGYGWNSDFLTPSGAEHRGERFKPAKQVQGFAGKIMLTGFP